MMLMFPPWIDMKNKFFAAEKPGWIEKDLPPTYKGIMGLVTMHLFSDTVIDWIIIHDF